MLELVSKVRCSGGEVRDLRVGNKPEPWDLVAFVQLVTLIRSCRPDIVHCHSSKAGALGRVAVLLSNHKRCFYSPQAYYGMAKPLSVKVRFYNWIERKLGGIGTTIAISRDEADFAHKVLRVKTERIRIVHNPVDTQEFLPATSEERRSARKSLGISDETIVLAIIGRMCWQKDPETAYAGVAPVCLENRDLNLFHLGWGKWKEYLRSFARDRHIGDQVRIIDYIDDPRSFFHAIDALLVSSRYEAGWPLVFLEAMACNLPVIAATGLGMSDVGKANLSHVWTFAPEDVPGCTQAIRDWLANFRRGGGECNHRVFAIERLSPERCFGALLRIYRGDTFSASVSPFDLDSGRK